MNTYISSNFYVASPWPKLIPKLIKIGVSKNTKHRMDQHKILAPFIEIVETIPVNSRYAESVVKAAIKRGFIGSVSEMLTSELYIVDSVTEFIRDVKNHLLPYTERL